MSIWNYVVTANKPTNVTHSCVGNFTGPQERNLVIAKSTCIQIHLLTSQGLQRVLDVPIYGRIATLELFRPHGEAQDLLFISTERYTFCVLEWDAVAGEVNTRTSGDLWLGHGVPTDNGQICLIDPDCRLIVLRLDEDIFKVIELEKKVDVKKSHIVRLREQQVLDIKFLYGCTKPTIAVLYQDNEGVRHVKSHEIDKHGILNEGPLSLRDLDNGAYLLIPVPSPLCGVLIIGKEAIVYRCASAAGKAISIRPAIMRAYARVDADGSRYLLGDHNGALHLLVITHEKGIVTGLKIEFLVETSIASTISYLDNYVYIGSSYGDSQLIKLNPEPDAKSSYVVLTRYCNLGPIVDFCVVERERQGQSQVVTCSGAYKDGSLRILRSGMGISEQASVKVEGILGIWSLKSENSTFLVVSFLMNTKILAMNCDDNLEETKIVGFCYDVQTFFCHDAVYNQLVQVTSNSVKLVSFTSGEMQKEWFAPTGFSINVAAANATQVLLATGDKRLIYLEIGDGILTEVKQALLEYDISCLDINPIGENPNRSPLAAVGTWTDISVRIFSLPGLDLVRKELLGGEIIPRSVLMCSFEGVSYLFCALGDGHLLNFVFSMDTGELTDRKKVSLGNESINLGTFSSKNAIHVFAASNGPTVIYSSKKELLYSNVANLDKVSHMCPFSCAALPDSLAIAKEDKLAIVTFDERVHMRTFRTIPLGEHARRICHQKQTRTYALCSIKYNQSSSEDPEEHRVHLLDGQTFKFISTYTLGQYEYACSIVSCSFSGDGSVYYCVGTAFVIPDLDEDEPSKGRILVFTAKDGKLELLSEKETKGSVYSLNAFNGKLLAAINQNIQLYNWVLWEDGTRGLQSGPVHHVDILARHVQTRGYSIVVGDLMNSIFLLWYKDEEDEIVEEARDPKEKWMSAVEILDDDIYLGAENNYNLFTVRKVRDLVTYTDRLKVAGMYHLGDFVYRFQHGSLVMHPPDSDVGKIPTVIFGTENGVIGVIASLPLDQYRFMKKLQSNLRKVRKGIGGMSHAVWRSFYNEKKIRKAKKFVDGDFVQSFLYLSSQEKENVSHLMSLSVKELTQRVRELAGLLLPMREESD